MIRRNRGYNAVLVLNSHEGSELTKDNFPISIFFPDIPECISCANSEDDAIKYAKESLLLAIYGKRLRDLPQPRSPSEIVEFFSIIVPVYVDKKNIVHYNENSLVDCDSYNLDFCVVVLHFLNRDSIFFPDIPECYDNMVKESFYHINDKDLFTSEMCQLIGNTINEKYSLNEIHTRKGEDIVKTLYVEVETYIDGDGKIRDIENKVIEFNNW